MQDFTKLDVWQRAHSMTLDLYRKTKSFPREELYGLSNQIRRAAASIGANIAEGCGRDGKAELGRFLRSRSARPANFSTTFCLPVTCHMCRPEITNVLLQRSPA